MRFLALKGKKWRPKVATASLPSDSNDNGFQPLQKSPTAGMPLPLKLPLH